MSKQYNEWRGSFHLRVSEEVFIGCATCCCHVTKSLYRISGYITTFWVLNAPLKKINFSLQPADSTKCIAHVLNFGCSTLATILFLRIELSHFSLPVTILYKKLSFSPVKAAVHTASICTAPNVLAFEFFLIVSRVLIK